MTDKKIEIGSPVPGDVLKGLGISYSAENENYGWVNYGRAGNDYFKNKNGIFIYITEEDFHRLK